MPLLDRADIDALREEAPVACTKCSRPARRDYCRQCDEFFWRCCSCPSEHAAHRTYASVVSPSQMNDKERVELSKRMSYALRHHPEKFGVSLHDGGWVKVDDLAQALGVAWETLVVIAEMPSDKVRFSLQSDAGATWIRAAQGHSVAVDLQLPRVEPPDMLFHGTRVGVLDKIFDEGLKPMDRTHVHLSTDIETALRVGTRRGKPIILQVSSFAAHVDGISFYRADNGVWLADRVPPVYLTATCPSRRK
jgi:putative RNA 2'-phosphotransferase